jgi:xanthine permease XanP
MASNKALVYFGTVEICKRFSLNRYCKTAIKYMGTVMKNETNKLTQNSKTKETLLFGLNDKPPLLIALLTGFQHFIGMFVSIITAPLIICLGLGLPTAEVNAIISASLLISGIGTIIQVIGIGPFGSRLLSVQGTSYAFIGTIILAGTQFQQHLSHEAMMGTLFGTMAVGALSFILMSLFVEHLKPFFTTTVAGVAVILLGIYLVLTTVENFFRDFDAVAQQGQSTLLFSLMAFSVALLILLFTRSQNQWLRLSSISLGLAIGYVFALLIGQIDFTPMYQLPIIFIPDLVKYPIGFDWGFFLTLLPVYIATMAESIGDITATSALSKQPIIGQSYWERIRHGLLAEGVNSFFASILNTFPLTTFSQNNGVIRLTGVASRYIGIFIGVFLILFGVFPVIGGLFQVMPKSILHGATGLMFIMIVVSGFRIILMSMPSKRDWLIAGIAIGIALLLSLLSAHINMNAQLQQFLAFPVPIGTLLAIILEKIIPSQS